MAKIEERPAPLYCSFCGKHQDYVQQLIAGPTALICDECIELCQSVVDEARAKNEERAKK